MIKHMVMEYIRFSIIFGVIDTFLTTKHRDSPLRYEDGRIDKSWVIRWFILMTIIWPYVAVMSIWYTLRDFIRERKNRRDG